MIDVQLGDTVVLPGPNQRGTLIIDHWGNTLIFKPRRHFLVIEHNTFFGCFKLLNLSDFKRYDFNVESVRMRFEFAGE